MQDLRDTSRDRHQTYVREATERIGPAAPPNPPPNCVIILLGIPAVADLPAVKWRQRNLDKLSKEKRAELVVALEKVLFK